MATNNVEQVLGTLRARLLDTADWLEKRKLPENESPYTASAGLTPKKGKRLEPLLTAFRDALNSGAFADDSEMQCERARAFPEDIAENVEVPQSRMRGNWSNYQSYGDARLMFLERLMRGWLPDYDFGDAGSIEESVVWQFRNPLTVPKYVEGLRYLARAVEKEMDRRGAARSENQNAGLADGLSQWEKAIPEEVENEKGTELETLRKLRDYAAAVLAVIDARGLEGAEHISRKSPLAHQCRHELENADHYLGHLLFNLPRVPQQSGGVPTLLAFPINALTSEQHQTAQAGAGCNESTEQISPSDERQAKGKAERKRSGSEDAQRLGKAMEEMEVRESQSS